MSGCVNIALRDILAGSVAGGYGCQPLKAGGAAQPGGCSACFVPVEPGLDLILFIVQLGLLEEFLFADGGDEFLEVEWFEVGDVFKAALAVGAEGRLEHC